MSRFAMQRSRGMEHATEMLRNGQTRRQKDQAMMDKAAFAVGQAGLTSIGAGLSMEHSRSLKEEQHNRGVMQNAIHEQTLMANDDDRHMWEASQYADADQHAELGVGGRPMPAWLQREGVSQGKEDPVQSMADIASKNQSLNASAAGAAIGGYRTPRGLDDTENEADMRAADINTSKNMMRMGGLMGGMQQSLPRTRGY